MVPKPQVLKGGVVGIERPVGRMAVSNVAVFPETVRQQAQRDARRRFRRGGGSVATQEGAEDHACKQGGELKCRKVVVVVKYPGYGVVRQVVH